MFKNYVLIALRNISRQKLYSGLNISGLAVGLAAFILIILYVQYELSFDKHHENADRIYRVVRDGRTLTPAALGPALADNFSEVEAVARIIQDKNTLVSRGDNHFLEMEFYWAGPGIFDVLTLPFVLGSPDSALREPSTVVISESSAKKYFGDESPLGKVLNINDSADYKVTGVFEDMSANSHFVMDIVAPYVDYFKTTGNDISSWTSNFTYTYFLLREGADFTALQGDIHRVIEKPLFERFGVPKPYPKMYFVQPITEIHLKSHRMQEISVNNDMKYVYLFSSIAFLILFIACINYVNLATARSVRRGKEVGIRKVVGARRAQLIQQFLGESFFVILLALGLGLLIVDLVLPTFNNLVERQLSMAAMTEPQFIAGLLSTVIVVALLAGAYPAMTISAFKPVSVLKGAIGIGTSGRKLRNLLVLFQFSVTTALFICTLTINEQLDFVNQFDVGYDKNNVVTVKIRDNAVRRNIETIKSELLKSPGVIDISVSARLPNNIDTFTSKALNSKLPENETTIFYNTVDYDFVDLFGIEIERGRNFSREFSSDQEGVFLVNEAAVKAAGWDSPLQQTMTHWSGETGQIVGVMKDFHLHSLHSPIAPLYVFLDPGNFSNISLKVSSDNIPETIDFIRDVIKKFSPNFPFEYSFFDEEYSRVYHPEQQMVNIFSSFAVLAIIVACFGLLGLSAFAAQQRTKEIGIRKISGASVSKITILLSTEFVRWVVLANVIAWPVAYIFMDRWLQNFAVRIDQSFLNFLFSGAAALAIAVLTVSILSAKAASASPIKALRHEQ
jgi:putative ABC transport system permease protein